MERLSELSETDFINHFEGLVKLYEQDQCFNVVVKCDELIYAGYRLPEILNLRGIACYQLHQFQSALDNFQQAIQMDSSNIDYFINMGDVYAIMAEHEKAADSFSEAALLTKDTSEKATLIEKYLFHTEAARTNPHLLSSRSSSHLYPKLSREERDIILNEFERGSDIPLITKKLTQEFKFNVTEEEVRNSILISYINEGNSDKCYELAKKYLIDAPDAYLHNILIRSMVTASHDTRLEMYSESKAWSERWAQPKVSEIKKLQIDYPINEMKDIHVGFVCDYACSIFGKTLLLPLAKHLANNGLRVTFYNFDKYQYSSTLLNYRIENVGDLSMASIHKKMVNDRVTILLDTNGRMREKTTHELFTKRSAPIQMSYFNMPGTTGMESFDYIISDSYGIPVENEYLFTEKVIRLPCKAGAAFEFERDMPIEPAPCLVNGYVTFGSFNAPFKLNTPLLEMWAEILNKVPGSKLYLKCTDMLSQRVQKRILLTFSQYGIGPERLLLAGYSWLPYMRKCYAKVDICLDTYPQNAGSSNQHAIWQGVPVLTLHGDDLRSSLAAPLLASIGKQELIAKSKEEYIEKAVKLSESFEHLQQLRTDISQSIHASPFFNPELVYKELSDKFFEISKKYCTETQAANREAS